MPWLTKNSPVLLERIVSALCYFTFGLAGILYSIFKPAQARSLFFRFHFIQAIMLCIIQYLLNWSFNFLIEATGEIFKTFNIVHGLELTMTGLSYLAMGIGKLFWVLLAYGAVWALMGKYAEIPFISSMARKQI